MSDRRYVHLLTFVVKTHMNLSFRVIQDFLGKSLDCSHQKILFKKGLHEIVNDFNYKCFYDFIKELNRCIF